MEIQAYIDTDVLLYKFGFKNETSIEWSDGQWTYSGNLPSAITDMDNFIDDIVESLVNWSDVPDAQVDVQMCFSSKAGSFRQMVYDGYKKSRKGKRKPVLMDPLKQWVYDNWEVIEEPWLEGDDILGVWGGSYDQDSRMTAGPVKVMCSIDKDMLTVPGYHYNWDKSDLGVVWVGRDTASKNFYLQTLSGDTVDDYPGCPTIGPKRALKILDEALNSNVPMWEAIVKTYEKHGKDELFALQMARCAYILQPEDFDIECGSIDLWAPRVVRNYDQS